MNIPTYQLTVWIAIIAVKLVLAGLLVGARGRRYTAFKSYVFISGAGSIGLYAVHAMAGPEAYFWAYWSKQSVDSGLVLWVIYDLFYELFHPFWTIPRRTRDTALYIFLPAAICLTISAVLFPSSLPECFLRTARMYSRAVTFNALLSMAAIILLAKYFMIPWRVRTKGIAAGLVLPLLIQSMLSVVGSTSGTIAHQFIGTIGMLSDLFGISAWAWIFRPGIQEATSFSHEHERVLHSKVLRLKCRVQAISGIHEDEISPALFTPKRSGIIVDTSSEQFTKGCDRPYVV